jgi:hypothetical protein
LATVYRPDLFPLLEQALTDRHKPCHEAAWRILALPINVRRDDGEWISRPRLFDRLTPEQRASLHARVPRVAGLLAEEPRASAPPPPPTLRTTRSARSAAPGHRSERAPSRAQASSTKPRRSRTHPEVELPVAARDLNAEAERSTLRVL